MHGVFRDLGSPEPVRQQALRYFDEPIRHRNNAMLDPFAMDWIPVLIRSSDTDWDYVWVGLLAVVEGDCDYCHYSPSVLEDSRKLCVTAAG
jgi:hypothetical protein